MTERSENRKHRQRGDSRTGRKQRGERPKANPAVIERPAQPAKKPAAQPLKKPEPRRIGGQWLYGRHAVAAALANPARFVRRLAAQTESAPEAQTLLAGALAKKAAGIAVEPFDRAGLAALLPEGAVHQGIALQVEPLIPVFLDDFLAEFGPPAHQAGGHDTENRLVILLDQVTDPHNVGAVLRSAAAFGALAIILPEHGAPPVSGVLAKAASGALEYVPLIRVVNLARALDRLKEAGFWSIGLDEAADKVLSEIEPAGRVALVLGAEGEGLRRLTRERCDHLARLPTSGPIASLNISNAAAIALYELARKR